MATTKYLRNTILGFMITALLAACGGGGGEGGSGSGVSTVSTSFSFVNGDGRPELTAVPTFNPASVTTAASSLTVNVPVDSDTAGVLVAVGSTINQAHFSLTTPITPGTAQTVSIVVPISSSLTAGGTYYAMAFACYSQPTGCELSGTQYGPSTAVPATYVKTIPGFPSTVIETGVALTALTVQ